MTYTLGQAAKATGKSKPTILEQIKKGRISAEKNPMGHYKIEPSELHRLYPPLSQAEREERDGPNEGDPAFTAKKEAQIKALEARLEVMEELVSELRGNKTQAERREAEASRREADLRRDLENWRGFAFEAQQRLKALEPPIRPAQEETIIIASASDPLHPQNEKEPHQKKGFNPLNPFSWFKSVA